METGVHTEKTKKLKGCTGDREGLWLEPAGPLVSLYQHSPVPVLLNAVATPLASLPVACVPEGLGGLRGTVEDAKPVPQTGLKIALVHLISAIPRERCTNGWSHLKELSPEDTPPPTFPLQAKGHLLTDAVLAHPAFPPVALVTVKLVLKGLGHQADAKAVRVVGWGCELVSRSLA